MVNIITTQNGRCNVQIQIGTQHSVSNMPLAMVDGYVSRYIQERIHHIFNHRYEEMQNSIGNYPRCQAALDHMCTVFYNMPYWNDATLAYHIAAYKKGLLSLLDVQAPTYRATSQTVFDLIIMAENQLKTLKNERN